MTSPPHRLNRPDTPESRARWLHETGGLSVEEIGWRLGLPAARVKALLEAGAVQAVKLPGGASGARLMRQLSHQLRDSYGLRAVHLAPLGPGESDPLPAIAATAARWLTRLVQSREAPKVVGLTHGRSLAAMVRQLPEIHAPDLRFVSLAGDLTRAHTAYPHAVMSHLAQRFGAQAFPLPATLYVSSPEERAELMALPMVARVMALMREADLWIVGIGSVSVENQLMGTGMLQTDGLDELAGRDAECEVLGRFFDGAGHELDTRIARCTLAPEAADFARHRLVGLAGGAEKVGPIRAALRGRLVQELITDSQTAVALLTPEARVEYALLLE
ncbi:sugar-binding transcriptional regulator [Rhodobacter maris]|uniref:DNA-binding transcriptional regulator LsrR (DeoR family) n=1 Tax=Rhodobacter maris TaxID=446682 RepID=A0A285RGB7_9RHOB|nr:sugar-binding domain-containing protein [Rhodobacter maris]SOB93130.1 DNA-binding transcriptional regulator LsrR (DeoR family) [Rhodobacter maris]